jgi:peptidoglycan hydrolase-like protein with peptidoglycan-binding domain
LAIGKFLLIGTALVLCASYLPAQQKQAAKSTKAAHRHGKRKTAWKKKGQQGIKPERATEIQQALIREKYLTGEPSGVWDARSQAAMMKFQADNGWQTKEIPDSRALIKLGLGPNYSSETLLNGRPATTGATSTAASRSISGTTDKR